MKTSFQDTAALQFDLPSSFVYLLVQGSGLFFYYGGIMRNNAFLLLVLLSAIAISCAEENNINNAGPPAEKELVPNEDQVVEEDLVQIERELIKLDLFNYPELTFLIQVKDAQAARAVVAQYGGEVIYDPNLEVGADIGWLVVTLPPKTVSNAEFRNALKGNARKIALSDSRARKNYQVNMPANKAVALDQINVPTKDIQLDQLQARYPQKVLGEDTVVAVIDTGVDASHPAFQDRVVFWADATQEARVVLTEQTANAGQLSIASDLKLAVPKTFAEAEVEKFYVGVIEETKMWAQLNDADKVAGKTGLDINRNNKENDRFGLVMAQVDGQWLAFVDTNGDQKWQETESDKAIVDFNSHRNQKSDLDAKAFVRFPSRNRSIQYPLLINVDDEGKPESIDLGIDFNSHGTHVAGILAGNGVQVKGAAPAAKIMAIKVCSGLTCTGAAMLRGFVETFYNEEGIVPDIINMSLGSPESYNEDLFNLIIRDLSAKFGTTWFVSASNSGPGYRSLNNIGSIGPAIQVAAHVSKATLSQHYPVEPDIELADQQLLFFSSLGPSYTGVLRPNISAPGSAVSATPLINDLVSMFNGTSMSSPLAAGAAAALLSVVKENDSYKWIEELRKEKMADLSGAKGSLIGVPFLWREILESSSVEMQDYTLAHQGYGLLNMNQAHDDLLARVEALRESRLLPYFDTEVNDNDGEKRLYDRRLPIAPSKAISLSLRDDGELLEDAILAAKTANLQVRLEKVEVQSADGTKITLTENLPFAIAKRGFEEASLRETTLRLASPWMRAFYSRRFLEQMEPNKTYVAHYTVNLAGHRLNTLLDIVHMPIELKEQVTRVDIASLGVIEQSLKNAFVEKDVEIRANAMHRYPIAVRANDSILDIGVALSPERTGSLYVQLYNPDGIEVELESISRSQQNASIKPAVKFSHSTLKADGSVHTGIYELVISTGNRSWMGPTAYDLLIHSHQVLASHARVEMKLGETKSITLKNLDPEKTLKVSLNGLAPAMIEKKVPIRANHWSFVPLTLPDQPILSFLATVIRRGEEDAFFGRIDHRLFVKEEGSFKASDKKAFIGNASIRGFIGLLNDDQSYLALETFGNVPEAKEFKEQESVDLMIQYLSIPVQGQLQIKAEAQANGFVSVNLDSTTLAKENFTDSTNAVVANLEVKSGDKVLLTIPLVVQ